MTRKLFGAAAFGIALSAAVSLQAATDDASPRPTSTVAVQAGQGGTVLVQVPQTPRQVAAPYALTGQRESDSSGHWVLMRTGQGDLHRVRVAD